jgi:hypothetical protein
MAQPAIKKNLVKAFLKEHPNTSTRGIAKRFECSTRLVRVCRNELGLLPLPHGNGPRAEHHTAGVDTEFSEDKGYVEFRTNKHIKDIDTALEEQGIDLELWEVDRVKTTDNQWDVTMKMKTGEKSPDRAETHTNYQFKIMIWLRPRKPKPLIEAIKLLVKDIPTFKYHKSIPKFRAGSGNAVEMSLIDAHFGKLAWAMETGRRDYDLKIATQDYLNACEDNLGWTSMFEPEKIFFILGQDLMHVENFEGVTPKGGNILDVDSRLPKIFKTAMETVIKCIYMCRSIAPVEIIPIAGNHDMNITLALAHAIDQHFRDDEHVQVDTGPSKRKARLWGNLLVGWVHEIVGRETAWANELAQAFPKLWGKSVFREWHYGHKHKKQEIKITPISTQGGVLLRQLTALSPIDAWHTEYLFTDAVPGGESLLWSRNHGVIANFTSWSGSPVKLD